MYAGLAELIGVLIFAFAPALVGLFNRDPQVIAYGTLQARTITLFYFLLALSHSNAAVMRGAGRAIVPMIVMLVCWCLIRVTYVTIAVQFVPMLSTVSWAYPITWSLSTVVYTIYYFKSDWMYTHEKRGLQPQN